MGESDSKLWTCPNCGHRFVTRNIWHSCGRYAIEDHFHKANEHVHATFLTLADIMEQLGPVTYYAQKTRIVFMVEVRFAGVTIRQNWLNLSLWMTRRISHPRLARTEVFGANSYGHRFKLSRPQDIDDALISFISEAYSVGKRNHLSKK